MTEGAVEGEALERTNMLWPPSLKEAVRAKVGARGLTEFTIGAVEQRLTGEDRVRDLEKEVGQLRYLCQLLADRVAMGGDHEDRNHLLMEVELPSWMKTEGWPADMKGLVPPVPPKVEKIEVEKPPLNTPGAVPPPAVAPGEAAKEVKLGGSYTAEELAKPAHQVAAEKKAEAEPVEHAVGDTVEVGGIEFTKVGEDPFSAPEGDDLFSRIQAKAAEKGVDISGAGLVPASTLPKPGADAHNHAFERREDGNLYCTGCSGWIDESVTPGKFHEGEVPTEPAPELEVQTPVPTPVAPEPVTAPTRDLTDIDVDF